MSDDGKKTPSRLERQLAILGLGDQALPEAQLAAERRAMAEAAPKPLHFPVSRPEAAEGAAWWRRLPPLPRRAWPAFAVLAAAGVAFVLMPRGGPQPPPFQVMGGSNVQVFTEQAGNVAEWKAGVDLPAGARVKASVLAPAAAAAFWGVVARDGRLLSDPAWIARNRLDLAAGARQEFTGSLELDGASEHEVLVVVVCPAAGAEGRAAEVARAMPGPQLPATLGDCRAERFPLRH